MYKHILIPTDGSELSNRAVRQGIDLARAIGARVTVVTVTPTFRTFSADPFMATSTPEQFRRECQAEAERFLATAAAASPAGVVSRPCTGRTIVRIRPSSTPRRRKTATSSSWRRTGERESRRWCWAARRTRSSLIARSRCSFADERGRRPDRRPDGLLALLEARAAGRPAPRAPGSELIPMHVLVEGTLWSASPFNMARVREFFANG